MTTDFRALCAELTAWAEKTSAHYFQPPDVLLRARAALSDEPAVPTPPADGEAAELVAWLQEEADDYECIGCEDSAAKCKRAAELLQRQAPQPPADGEVAELVEGLRLISDGMSAIGHDSDSWFVARAADLLQRLSPPQPVPVSELSPVAQAVLDSTMGLAATVREAQAVAAAALRAAADRLPLQPLTRDPADPFEQGLRQGQELSRAELLGIAAELEAT